MCAALKRLVEVGVLMGSSCLCEGSETVSNSSSHMSYIECLMSCLKWYTLRHKGIKAVTVAVPFQKVHVCA